MTPRSRYPYLIEFRLCGKPRGEAKKLIYDLYKKFGVRENLRQRPVPHVTLYGPFQARSVRQIANIIKDAAQDFDAFRYTINKFDSFDKKTGWFSKRKHVVYLKINARSDIKKFHSKLYQRLVEITDPKDPDIEKMNPFPFHVTLALKDIDEKFDDIWKYLSKTNIRLRGEFCGVTLLRDGKIMCEYDLARHRLLDREQALRRRCTSS